jgi:hypothetical protein
MKKMPSNGDSDFPQKCEKLWRSRRESDEFETDKSRRESAVHVGNVKILNDVEMNEIKSAIDSIDRHSNRTNSKSDKFGSSPELQNGP